MSQEIYDHNIKALLKINHISLVNALETVELDSQERCVVFEGNEEDSKVLKVRNSNRNNYILYNSFYNPMKEAEELTKHIDYTINRSLIVAIGVGMGYHLKQICNHLNEKSTLLAIENDEIILKTLLWHQDFSDFIEDGKIYFALVDDDEAELKEVSKIVNNLFLNIYEIQTVLLPIYDLSYMKFSRKTVAYLADLRNMLEFGVGNDLDDTIDGIENHLYNLPHVIKNPGFKQLREKYIDVYKNKLAIIIASGPSLDKNIHLLKEAKGKALLLACDGSMESLKKHGIVPDVVSSVERILLTYEAFYKDKKMPDETVLVAPAVVRPEIMKCFSNKTLSLFKSEPISGYFNEMVNDKGTVFSGSSVAHQLLGIATALGASPIILVGQDLAYSREGVSHTSEASVKEKVNVKDVNLFVKDIYGEDIPTTIIWKLFKQVYEKYIAYLNIDCIDATEGGAFIEGTKIMTLREVIDTYCVDDLPNFRGLVDSINVESNDISRAYHNSLSKIIQWSKKYNLLRLRSLKSMELNNQSQNKMTLGLNTDEELDFIYDALDYTENKIVKNLAKQPDLTMFFQYPITLAVREINKLGSEYTLETIQANLDIHLKLLKTINSYCVKVMKVLETGFDFMKQNAIETNRDESISFKEIHYPDYLKVSNFKNEKSGVRE